MAQLIPVLTQHRTDGLVDVMLPLDTQAVRRNHDRLGPEAPEGFITIGHLLPVHTATGYQRYRPDTPLAHYIAARLAQPVAYWATVEAESPVWAALVSALPVEPQPRYEADSTGGNRPLYSHGVAADDPGRAPGQ